MKYGIWVDNPHGYTGWFGLAAPNAQGSDNGMFAPWQFDSVEEAEIVAQRWQKAEPGANVEVRENPPEVMPYRPGAD